MEVQDVGDLGAAGGRAARPGSNPERGTGASTGEAGADRGVEGGEAEIEEGIAGTATKRKTATGFGAAKEDQVGGNWWRGELGANGEGGEGGKGGGRRWGWAGARSMAMGNGGGAEVSGAMGESESGGFHPPISFLYRFKPKTEPKLMVTFPINRITEN